MKAFTYERVKTPADAASSALQHPGAKFIAGGTNLLDLMKLEIEQPSHLIDVNGLALDTIEPDGNGGLRIGALVRNTDLAADLRILLSEEDKNPIRTKNKQINLLKEGNHKI